MVFKSASGKVNGKFIAKLNLEIIAKKGKQKTDKKNSTK